MLITGDLKDLSTDFQRAEISSGTHTHRIVPYRVFMGWFSHSMAKYTVTCTNGTDVFEEKVEADTVDFRGVMVLFMRKVIGGSPAFDKDEVVAGFQRDRLISFIVTGSGKTNGGD